MREEWEKIYLAYSILSDKKQRLKYDRHSVLDDLGSAMAWSIGSLTNGMSMVAKTIMNTIEEGHKMPQKFEHSVAEIKVQVRSREVAKEKHDLYQSNSSTKEKIETFTSDSVTSTVNQLGKGVVVPPPKNNKYYSPFEACSIIHEHEINPSMNKPQAMRVMLDNEYVPVKRSQLYLLLNRFKKGGITEANEWGRVGRPQAVGL